MAYEIDSSKCVGCGSCASSCPAGCIESRGSYYEIDASSCIQCGTCASVCPHNAVKG